MSSKWIEISKMPTLFNNEKGERCGESLLRSFHIVREVKELLEKGVPAQTILDIIEVMEVREDGLRDALGFYANRDNWDTGRDCDQPSKVECDGGDIAQEALK
jgi:hypothetical protein